MKGISFSQGRGSGTLLKGLSFVPLRLKATAGLWSPLSRVVSGVCSLAVQCLRSKYLGLSSASSVSCSPHSDYTCYFFVPASLQARTLSNEVFLSQNTFSPSSLVFILDLNSEALHCAPYPHLSCSSRVEMKYSRV